jgi:hypothetical protein
MLMAPKEFTAGTTIRLKSKATVDGTTALPDSVIVTVVAPDGSTPVLEQPMDRNGTTGWYELLWAIPGSADPGLYVQRTRAVSGNWPGVRESTFVVV